MKKIFTLFLVLGSLLSFSQSTTIVISQAYSGGGTITGPVTYFTDYVELHNISTVTQDLTLYSIQYGSATGNFGNTSAQKFKFPDGTMMPAGSYLLIQVGQPGTAGATFPVTPDFVTGNASMGATAGKVALVSDTTGIGCGATATACTLPAPNIVDLVAWGNSNNAEGGAAVGDLSKTTGAVRKLNGCQDTDNNAADFDIVDNPVPRNSASPVDLCGGPPTPTLAAGTVVDFGNVVVGTNSVSQSFNLSGDNLTGAPGDITITAPSSDFQVSNDNTAWGASTTISYTSATLASTPVYVRFTPQSVGPKTGNVNISGGGAASVNVAVSGNGITAGVATVTIAGSSPAFGDVCINITAGPASFTINGDNLTTADLTVGPLNGFTFSTTSGGVYTPSLTLAHGSGTYTQDVFVEFTPVTVSSYDGNIPVTGGGLASPVNVPVTGSGINSTATVVTGGSSAVTSNSATLAGTLPVQGCSPVTSYGFEYSLISGFINGNVVPSTNLAGTAFSANVTGLLASTTYYYKAFAINAGGTIYGIEMSFTTLPGTSSFFATNLSGFGNSCVNIAAGPNAFDITGLNLTTADIIIGPLTGYTFSATAGGAYTPILTLTQPGGNFTATVYVKFTPPSIGTFNNSIPVTGGGVIAFAVPVSGTGSNTVPSLNTSDATDVAVNSATAGGSLVSPGCTPVISYGIEYSGINGFVNGSGTKVESTNLSGTDFSARLSGLVQATIYYYKSYAINDGGAGYGPQKSFKTAAIPDGFVIYSTPVVRGQNVHFSLSGIKTGHYSVRIHNIVGQLVFQKDLILQVNFIDDNFILPAKLPVGLYYMEIRNYQYEIQKPFMVQ